MRYLGLLRGLPGAGKSYFVETGLSTFTLSSDDYRLRLSSPTLNVDGTTTINQAVSNRAWKNLRADLEYRMSNGDFTLIDATNISRKEVLSYRSLCKKYNYKLFIVDFTDVDIELCKSRNERRGFRKVPESVIDRMNKKLKTEDIPKSIKVVKPDDLYRFLNDIYTPLNFDCYNEVHVIGDIHGCYTALMDTMKHIDLIQDAVIFVGDYFDRGIENVEVFNFMYSIKDNKNVFMCIGNHEERIFKYLRGEDVSHTQFYNQTLKQFKEAGITDKQMRSFCHSLITCALFDYHNKGYLVSHGGVSDICVHPFYSDSMFIHGVGEYEDMIEVCNTWDERDRGIQIFGHRNNEDKAIKINDTCYNVCGFPEYGGDLKSVTIIEDTVIPYYARNKVISKESRYKAIEKYPERFKIDVHDAISVFRHSKFVNENKFGNISSFNFSKDAFYDDIWNGATVKARGIFINTNTEKIVARSYDKFFLLDQHECSTIDNFSFPLTCYTKYDGFLGILGYDEETDEIVYCSKSMKAPEGDYAQMFKEEVTKHIIDKEELKKLLKGRNVSLVFEVIIPDKDEHIIKYDKPQLILLDMVKNKIDFYMFEYNLTKRLGGMYFEGLKYKSYVTTIADEDTFIKELVDFKGVINKEGFVFVDTHNKMFKLKTYDYEVGKLTRNQLEYYTNIFEHIESNSAKIKYPDEKKFFDKYVGFYDQGVISKLYKNTCAIIDDINIKISKL